MSFKIKILSKDRLVFDGVCTTLTSYNSVGEFDVLEYHANFITMISKYLIIDKNSPTEKKILLEKGILSSKGDTVDVFIQD